MIKSFWRISKRYSCMVFWMWLSLTVNRSAFLEFLLHDDTIRWNIKNEKKIFFFSFLSLFCMPNLSVYTFWYFSGSRKLFPRRNYSTSKGSAGRSMKKLLLVKSLLIDNGFKGIFHLSAKTSQHCFIIFGVRFQKRELQRAKSSL